MKKMASYFICVAVIAFLTTGILFLCGYDQRHSIEFLKEFGWEVDENVIETEEVYIPKEFDAVYNNYNILQEEAGLSLDSCRGKRGVRYTYRVKNYPVPVDDEVRANVICVRGKPVAGDIMTVRIDGFMHSLLYPPA